VLLDRFMEESSPILCEHSKGWSFRNDVLSPVLIRMATQSCNQTHSLLLVTLTFSTGWMYLMLMKRNTTAISAKALS
jgi:hypothetical protein